MPPYSTNLFTVRVTDSGVPPLSDETSFAVIVLPLPQLDARAVDNLIRLSFQSLPGRSYQVQYKNALQDPNWLGLSAVIQGIGAEWEVDDDMTAHPSRFYRIIILN